VNAWGQSYIPKPEHGAAWITGASAGIGRAIALRLASEGWTVYATARSEEIALAIFNAGVYEPMRAHEFTAEKAGRHFDVNLQGVVNGLAPAMHGMIARKTGCLALVASVAGYRGLPKAAAYGATKAALINMTEALAYDLHPAGVRISVINPGFVETDATAVNDFDMPFLMQTDEAAERIVEGLKTPTIEIAFPRRFAFILKAMRFLPVGWYLRLGRKASPQHETKRPSNRLGVSWDQFSISTRTSD